MVFVQSASYFTDKLEVNVGVEGMNEAVMSLVFLRSLLK